MKNRESHYDFLKGISIIAVVFIHSTNATAGMDKVEIGSFNYYFTWIASSLCAFAVPAFFFVAGYFSANEPIDKIDKYKSYIEKRLKRILVPYIFWTALVVLVIHSNFSVKNFIYCLLLGRAMGPYYFIIPLVQLIILTPLLQVISRIKHGPLGILLLSLMSSTAFFYLQLYLGFKIKWWIPLLPFTTWIVFYFYGICFRKDKKIFYLDKITDLKQSIFLLLIAIVLYVAENYLFEIHLKLPASGVKITWVIYSICVINFLVHIKSKITNYPKLIVIIGKWSFGIFLMHELFRKTISDWASQITLMFSFQPMFQMVVVVSTLGVCIILYIISKKIMGEKTSNFLLGFN